MAFFFIRQMCRHLNSHICTIIIETPCGNGNYRVTCVRNIQNKLHFTYLKKLSKLPLSPFPPFSFFLLNIKQSFCIFTFYPSCQRFSLGLAELRMESPDQNSPCRLRRSHFLKAGREGATLPTSLIIGAESSFVLSWVLVLFLRPWAQQSSKAIFFKQQVGVLLQLEFVLCSTFIPWMIFMKTLPWAGKEGRIQE